jgi:hypothetical protein
LATRSPKSGVEHGADRLGQAPAQEAVASQHLGDPHHGKVRHRESAREALLRHGLAADAVELHVWTQRPESGHHGAAQAVARGLAGDK